MVVIDALTPHLSNITKGIDLEIIKNHWLKILKSIFIAIGVVWLPLEAFEGLSNDDVSLSFIFFLIISFILGLCFFLVDGHCGEGFLKNHIKIASTGFDTTIIVKFGNYFEENGWKAVAVNDFFDSRVDDKIISKNSLHGQVITKFWPNEEIVWQKEVLEAIGDKKKQHVKRKNGNTDRYPLGTTAYINKNDHHFLFTALTKTDTKTNKTQTNSQGLILTTRSLLAQARLVCANNHLVLPLMGSGLGRVGLKKSAILNLILTAIFEESKVSKITNTITVILPKQLKNEINLGRIAKDWN